MLQLSNPAFHLWPPETAATDSDIAALQKFFGPVPEDYVAFAREGTELQMHHRNNQIASHKAHNKWG